MGILLSALIAILLFSFTGAAQTPAPEIHSESFDAARLLSDLKTLSADDMEGRKPNTPGGAKARAFIEKRFHESGIKPFGETYLKSFSLKSSKENDGPQGVNVIGFIKGKQHPEQYIVITAHYDHLGIKNGKIYNGTNDNASGVTALFAIASYFHKHAPSHSLIFAALDAEEEGLKGGRAFVRDPPVNLQAIVLNVNVDMVCRDKKSTLYAVGTHQYPFLKPYLSDIGRPPVTFLLGHDGTAASEDDWTRDSDHYEFHKAKIPFIYFGTEDSKYHHEADDDFENVEPAFFVGAVETVLEGVKRLDAGLGESQSIVPVPRLRG
jgi:Zn-dependent M28 family amino/carboxypeptidase